MKSVYLCSPELPKEVREILTSSDLFKSEVFLIDIPACRYLAHPVSAHPDMLFYGMSNGVLLTDERYFSENRAFFDYLTDTFGVRVQTSQSRLSADYPGDVLFDILNVSGILYGRAGFAAPEIVSECKRAVAVRQGYARCSVLKMQTPDTELSFAVTSDTGLYRALTEDGIDTLLISPGGIRLPGYECGFIGGASAFIPGKNTVVFFGDVSEHPDYEKIREFIIRHGADMSYPRGIPLTDYGSLVQIV